MNTVVDFCWSVDTLQEVSVILSLQCKEKGPGPFLMQCWQSGATIKGTSTSLPA